jgi:hypothetical protein
VYGEKVQGEEDVQGEGPCDPLRQRARKPEQWPQARAVAVARIGLPDERCQEASGSSFIDCQ